MNWRFWRKKPKHVELKSLGVVVNTIGFWCVEVEIIDNRHIPFSDEHPYTD